MVNVSVYFDALTQGHFVEAAIQPYYDLLGAFFWVWAFGISLFMLYGKTRNYGVVTVVGLLIAPVVMSLLPASVHLLVYFLLAIGVTGILYRLYH